MTITELPHADILARLDRLTEAVDEIATLLALVTAELASIKQELVR